jgi:ADP-ribosylglycohydrolase/tetratricopeptide (TPR) repeat protein
MSIFDDLSRQRTTAVRLFLDRYAPCREFTKELNTDPPRHIILAFAGVGGNGKSALLRTLQKRCSYRLPPDQWEAVWRYPDEDFVDALSRAPGAVKVPAALLDFGAQPSGMNRPQEPLSALFILKRQLADHGIDTPRLDFAAVSYLHRSGADVKALLAELFPKSELMSMCDLADAFLPLPVMQIGTTLFELVNRRLDDLLTRKRLRHGVPRDVVEEVLGLPPEPDLIEIMPRLFGADLRAALTTGRHRPSRIVLLFDTYEAVAGEGNRPQFSGLGGPRWIRSLLGNLPLADGVLPVVAGRVPPDWPSALVDPIPERFIKITALGPLPAQFAHVYLTDAGIPAGSLQDALVEYTSVEPGLVHPLLLGLSADVALALDAGHGQQLDLTDLRASAELRDKERMLASRLLSQVGPEFEESLAAIAAARSFDHPTFVHLGTELDFPVSQGLFRRLVCFSFVTAQPGERFAVHQLLRRAVAAIAPDAVRRAHQVLATYYAAMPQQDEFAAQVEHIYHRAQLDPEDGTRLWLREMDKALAISRFDLCRSLLSIVADLAPPSAELTESCAYHVAKAEIALGRWEEAEQRLARLPADAPHTLLLQADLAFVRGDCPAAERFSEQALAAQAVASPPGRPGPARLPFLLRAAELMLFLGRFEEGRDRCREALAIIGPDGDGNEAVNWHAKLASIEFFNGHLDAAREQLAHASQRLEQIAPENRDRAGEAGLRVEEAVLAEAEDRPLDARRGQAEALRIRREIADVRGAAHALNGLGLAALQLRDPAEAEERFGEAARIAQDLGEELLLAKVTRGRAEAAALDGRYDDADELAARAVAGFERAAIPYDVAHGHLTQARVRRARGDERSWLTMADHVRHEIETQGFGSLYERSPEVKIPGADRIAAAMLAFAAGDALGVPWEGSPPDKIQAERIAEVPAPAWGWPRGSTSDDTAQMILVSQLLADTDGQPTAEQFMARLAAVIDQIRGIGPSTGKSIEHYQRTGALPDADPAQRPTNGAAMRMPPVGWMSPVGDDESRRELTRTLAIGTHQTAAAIGAACLVTAMNSWALEGVSVDTILAAAADELSWVAAHYADLPATRAALDGTWCPPSTGVNLDADQTAAGIVHVLSTTPDLASALPYVVRLGGDTDTVAALVGGILGARTPDLVAGLGWLELIDFQPRPDLAAHLAELRRRRYLHPAP